MQRMQAAGIEAFGAEVRMLELAAPASPASDEVVLSVRAAGVGNWDEIVRIGDWNVGRRPPLALGVEAAGVVAAVGADVTSLTPGRRGAHPPTAAATPGRMGRMARRSGRSRC